MDVILFPCWNPVILQIGPFQLRWYSLMFVVAFVVGYRILARLAGGLLPVDKDRASDLVFWLVLGVMLGGRIGYCLFYQQEYLTSWKVIAVWEGGLSFHGGLLGVVVAGVLWARKQRISPWRLLDCCALAVPPGIFAVRIANFINGELYGRVTDASVPWAMRFPTDPVALALLGVNEHGGLRDRERALMAKIEQGAWDKVRDQVPLRHPSQLYEALGEGVFVGLVLLAVYLATRARPLGRGAYGGLFLLAYGSARFVIEFFRQPDEQFRDANDQLGTVLGPFSMGQVLCAGMIAFGVFLVVWGWRRR